jgi:hypothetical protein
MRTLRRRSRRLFLLAPLALLLVALAPGLARAETHTFLDTTDLFPADQGVFGPATVYPSTIPVSGIPGTVTKVTVTLLDFGPGRPDDTDIGIRGPNGETVMLISDACGEAKINNSDWTFDDSAPTFVSNNGPCASNQTASFKPSNYLGGAPEPDDLSVEGGPEGPYLNALSFLSGDSPNGSWELFALDDDLMTTGLFLSGWALTLEVEPPPPPTVVAPVVPTPIVTLLPAPAAPAPPRATGRRAAKQAQCKKKSGKAKRRCMKRAKQLPV